MLAIRRAQIEQMEEEILRDFVRELADHFRVHLPEHYAALGDEGAKAAIRRGIKKGQGYQIVTRPGLTVFVRMMFLLGEDFDDDPELPWAAETLRDESIPYESTRLDRLTKACRTYLTSLR